MSLVLYRTSYPSAVSKKNKIKKRPKTCKILGTLGNVNVKKKAKLWVLILQVGSHGDGGGFFLACKNSGGRLPFNPRLRFFSSWRLARAHKFLSSGQNQSTVAQQAEMTAAECSLTGAGIVGCSSAELVFESLQVRVPAGGAGEFSSPEFNFCAAYSVSVPPPCYRSGT